MARPDGLEPRAHGFDGGKLSEYNIFSMDIAIRFRDIDSMGHVNNAVYFTFFEQGRVEFFKQVFGLEQITDVNIILGHIRCDFLKPIRLLDTIFLRLWVSKIGRKSYDFRYDIVQREDTRIIYAKGSSVQIFYDYGKACSVEIPDQIRSRLQDYYMAP